MGAVRHYIFGPLASDFTLSSLFLGAVLEISSVCTSPYLAIDILVDCLGATMEIHSDLQMAASDGLQLGQPQPGLELGYQAQLSESHHEHESYSGDRKEYTYGHTENEGHQPKTICGLRPATLWLALALGAVIVIAAVGGGVGATLAAKRLWSKYSHLESQSQPQSQPPVATVTVVPAESDRSLTTTSQPAAAATGLLNFTPPGPSNVTSLALDCNTLNNTITRVQVPEIDVSFEVRCSNDQRGGFPAANNAGTIKDILPLTMYTLEDCMLACASWNSISRTKVCRGVTFGQRMSDQWEKNHSNCWLKNGTGPGVYQDSVASALLQ